jgi:F-type H+-transporting ATPase subunit epsilon
MKLSLKIVTPERVVYEGEADSVSAMTDTGEVTVLPGHLPLVSTMRAGELRVRTGGTETLMVASTGFLEVKGGNEVVILADSAERVEELELEKIAAAKEAARKLLSEKRQVDDVHFTDAAAGLERELARERVAMKKYRKIPARPGETQP